MNCNGVKTKYSSIPVHELETTNAERAMYWLLKNNFIRMSVYYEIESQKLIKALKALGIKHNINFIEALNQNCQATYEFSLKDFQDDRK